MLLNERPGAKVFFSIGHKGETPDVYPGRIASAITVSAGPRGPQKTATIITLQKNLQDVEYLAERVVDLRFTRDRTEQVDALDGTETAPKSVTNLIMERNAALDAFLASREQSVSIEAESAAADA